MLYQVDRKNKWGYINSTGDVVVPIEWDACTDFAEGYGAVTDGQDVKIVNARGTIVGCCKNVFPNIVATYSNGLLKVVARDSRKCGYIDAFGRWRTPAIYVRSSDFGNEVAVVATESVKIKGIIDCNGVWKCQPKYYEIFEFDHNTSSTVAFVIEGDDLKCFLVDKEGNQVGDSVYDYGNPPSEGLIPVEREFRWGVVTEAGELVIPFTFDGIYPFHEGMAVAKGANGLLGIIDRCGHWLIHPTFHNIDRFSEGLCAAAIDDESGREMWGYIDPSGNWIIEPRLGVAWMFRGGVARFDTYSSDEDEDEPTQIGYIDRSGQSIWE